MVKYLMFYVPVAQLDRVSDSDSEGRAFESHRAYQKKRLVTTSRFFIKRSHIKSILYGDGIKIVQNGRNAVLNCLSSLIPCPQAYVGTSRGAMSS